MSALVVVPSVVVEADGIPLDSEVSRGLSEVRVQERLSQPTLCELVFSEPPARLAGRLAPGTAMRVQVGGRGEPLFVGEATAVEYVYEPTHGFELRIRGYDRLHRLRKRQTVRAHVSVTVRDLAEELVGDVGLSVDAAESGPLWDRVIQHRQSDLELLVSMAADCGLFFAVRDDVLHLLTLEGVGEAVPLVMGESLLEARLEANADLTCREVTVAGWDPRRAEIRTASASDARLGRAVAAEVPPDQVGGSGTRHLVDEGAADDRHAEGMARAELDARQAAEVTLWGVAQGNSSLHAGRPVEITGVADAVAGRYIVTTVTHTIDEQRGFLSELSSAPLPPPPRPTAVGATPGVVTRVDDPESLGRIQVSLPTFGGVETDWMEVVCPGAGSDKGLIALPTVDDQVLVLLAHQDPGQGVVLGGMYGTNGPPDSGVEGTAVRRYTFQTPGGQRIRLDDAANTLRLEDQTGSFVELSPDRVMLHAAVDLTIEAPGRRVFVRGQSIDFQSA